MIVVISFQCDLLCEMGNCRDCPNVTYIAYSAVKIHAISLRPRRSIYSRAVRGYSSFGWVLDGETERVIECGRACALRRHTRCGLAGEHSRTRAAVPNTNRKQIRSRVAVGRGGARNDIRPCVKHRRRIQSVSEGLSREGESSSIRASGAQPECRISANTPVY